MRGGVFPRRGIEAGPIHNSGVIDRRPLFASFSYSKFMYQFGAKSIVWMTIHIHLSVIRRFVNSHAAGPSFAAADGRGLVSPGFPARLLGDFRLAPLTISTSIGSESDFRRFGNWTPTEPSSAGVCPICPMNPSRGIPLDDGCLNWSMNQERWSSHRVNSDFTKFPARRKGRLSDSVASLDHSSEPGAIWGVNPQFASIPRKPLEVTANCDAPKPLDLIQPSL
jgi:hypothetical protein